MKELFLPTYEADRSKWMEYGVVFPSVVLVSIVLIDFLLFPTVTITPPGSMILLVVISLRLPPRAVAIWSIIFLIVSMVVLQINYAAPTPEASPLIRASLRACTLLAGSIAAILLSHHRVRINRLNEETLVTLEKLPVPMVVSDASGNISFVNDAAAHLLGMERAEAAGLSYFALLLGQIDKGKSIARYLKVFDQRGHESISLPIRLASNPETLYQGTLVASGEGNRRRIVTVFLPGSQYIVPHSQWPEA